jgi:aspartate aminotransferase
MPDTLLDRLHAAYQVLGGTDAEGNPVHVNIFDPRVISFASGDGVRRPPAAAVAAGLSALVDTTESSLEDYMFMKPHEAFGSAIYDDFANNGIPPEVAINLCGASGTTRIFIAFLWACGSPGDVFLVPRSFYHPLAEWCDISRVGLELVDTRREDDYKLTAESLDRWYAANPDLAGKARGLFLFNPTQTGAVYTEAELKEIGLAIEQHDLVVLEDSVFAGTEFPGAPQIRHLGAVLPELNSRIVTLRGASKTHNLANIRIGWACGGDLAIINKMREHIVMSQTTIPHIAKSMAAAALRAPQSYRDLNSAECGRRSTLVTELVAACNQELAAWSDQPPLEVPHQPQAGHGIMISAPGLLDSTLGVGNGIRNSIDATRFFLCEAMVAMSPGYSLGFDGPELRLSIGSVGADRTYARTAASEFAAVFETLADTLDRLGLKHSGQCRDLRDLFAEQAQEASEDMFAPGRDLITEGFMERALPAMKAYLKRNAKRGHGTLA